VVAVATASPIVSRRASRWLEVDLVVAAAVPVGGLALWDLLFLFFLNILCRERMGLLAHFYREDLTWLSAKSFLPTKFCRVHFAKCYLSAKGLPRGIVLLPRASGSRQRATSHSG
jgi:hypothetical protein